MKKIICLLMSAIMVAGIFTVLPFGAAAAVKRVSLSRSSATLKVTKKNGKTTYGKTAIKLKKLKGVSVKRVAYKTSDRKVAVVSNKGVVTARGSGKAKITVGVRFTYKKKAVTKKMSFKVTVKTVKVKPTTPAEPVEPTVSNDFKGKLQDFSNRLYEMSSKKEDGNYTMSPVSVYMALAMLYSAGDEKVKGDIEQLVGMDESDFQNTGSLFKSLTKQYKMFDYEEMKEVSVAQLSLTNSVWLDTNVEADKDALKKLSDELSCDGYTVPFKDDNKAANQKIREFVKKHTNGLIDNDFGISEDALFALINTLYFKDIWNESSSDLYTKQRNFTSKSGTEKCEFLYGYYNSGKVQETESSQYFFTTTEHGYKIKFIVPKDGYTVGDVMTAKNLNSINSDKDFDFVDKTGCEHYTRCIFPSFKIESDTPLTNILKGNGYLANAFGSFFSPLAKDQELAVSDIIHKTVLDVNKKGVEGAAVTAVIECAASAPVETPKQYHDFVVNKSFGFVVTDPDDVILFEGMVEKP